MRVVVVVMVVAMVADLGGFRGGALPALFR
jgi:hypothetical protein